jgi:hypothetical protein
MIRLNVPIFKFKKHTRTGIHTRTRTWDYMACATSPCNRVYVLNGKIDECRGTRRRDISLVQGRERGVSIR